MSPARAARDRSRVNDPLDSRFALGADPHEIEKAVERARKRLVQAEQAHELVLMQAICALNKMSYPVRVSAKRLGISKSAVSRIKNHHDRVAPPFGGCVATEYEAEVPRLVYQMWGELAEPLSAEEVIERARPHMLKPAPASSHYHLTVYTFPDDWEESRDSLFTALEQSAWMADHVAAVSDPWSCTLWHLSQDVKLSTTRAAFDKSVETIRAFAVLSSCRLDFRVRTLHSS